LEEVDLTIFLGISFVVKSDVDEERLGYYMILNKWDEEHIDFKLNFDEPEYVS
jgi:hypothetical protein